MAAGVPDDHLVFPVGHLVGALGTPAGSVRVGERLVTMGGDGTLAVWGLAHGDESRVGIRPWTVGDLLRSATDAGIPDPEALLRRLSAAGLLITVGRDSSEAADFARTYRLVPLKVGRGALPEQPGRYALAANLRGLPSTYLTEDLYAVWRYAPLTTSLWDMAQRFSRQALDHGVPAEEASVDVVLGDILDTLHVLLSQVAGYLDLARH